MDGLIEGRVDGLVEGRVEGKVECWVEDWTTGGQGQGDIFTILMKKIINTVHIYMYIFYNKIKI